jgi:hypothetical protein
MVRLLLQRGAQGPVSGERERDSNPFHPTHSLLVPYHGPCHPCLSSAVIALPVRASGLAADHGPPS